MVGSVLKINSEMKRTLLIFVSFIAKHKNSFS